MSRRPPPNLPPEEPAIPIEPAVAKARASFIRSQIEKMVRAKAEGKSETYIREEVARFAEDYPTLYKKVLESGGDDPSLRTMLAMLDRMGTGELSQHQASVIVGQRLHDKYIKPKLDSE
jgi:hypothetical protein